MELGEKIQQLRKVKNMTQEDLASAIFVSRTAISKWESGRGYPSIDSIKLLSEFFHVSIDELLSGKELLSVAENDNIKRINKFKFIVLGLLDCLVILFLFLPIFGEKIDGYIYSNSLLKTTSYQSYLKIGYIVIISLTSVWGVLELIFAGFLDKVDSKIISIITLFVSAALVGSFIISQQPYAGSFALLLMTIKIFLMLKRV